MQETWIWSSGWEDSQRRAWQPTPVFLPGESLWTEEPGGLQSLGLQRVDSTEWLNTAQVSKKLNVAKSLQGRWRRRNGFSQTGSSSLSCSDRNLLESVIERRWLLAHPSWALDSDSWKLLTPSPWGVHFTHCFYSESCFQLWESELLRLPKSVEASV